MALETINKAQTFEEKLNEKEKKLQRRTKGLANMLGRNILIYLAILLPFVMVSMIWTEVGLPTIGWGLALDGVVSCVMFFFGEFVMQEIGKDSGKLDNEYIETHTKFKTMAKEVIDNGFALLFPFCLWEIDQEKEQVIRRRCTHAGLSYDYWNKNYSKKTKKELIQELGKKRGLEVYSVKQVRPIRLTPEQLLSDGKADTNRGGITESGDNFIAKRRRDITRIAVTIFLTFFTVSFSISLAKEISFASVVYTLIKVITLFVRMAGGFGDGCKAFNTIEVAHLQSKINLLSAYKEYCERKTYLQYGDQYGNIKEILGEKSAEDLTIGENVV